MVWRTTSCSLGIMLGPSGFVGAGADLPTASTPPSITNPAAIAIRDMVVLPAHRRPARASLLLDVFGNVFHRREEIRCGAVMSTVVPDDLLLARRLPQR